jgi:hypothetical protein
MATITMSINTGQGTVTRNRTVTGPHLVRMLTAYKGLLGQVSDGVGGFRDMTDEECILAWADGTLAGTKANVLRWERDQAAATASNAVTEITLT